MSTYVKSSLIAVLTLLLILVLVGCQQDGIASSVLARPAPFQVVDGCAIEQGGYCENSDLTGVSFDGAPLRKFTCINCTLVDTSWNGTNLSNGNLSGSTFTNADMLNSNMSGVNFTGAINLTQAQVDSFFRCSKRTTLDPPLTC